MDLHLFFALVFIIIFFLRYYYRNCTNIFLWLGIYEYWIYLLFCCFFVNFIATFSLIITKVHSNEEKVIEKEANKVTVLKISRVSFSGPQINSPQKTIFLCTFFTVYFTNNGSIRGGGWGGGGETSPININLVPYRPDLFILG